MSYFSGKRLVAVDKGGYTENLLISAAEEGAIKEAVASAVKNGRIWLVNSTISVLGLTTYQLCLREQNSLSYRHGLPVSRTQGCDPGWPSMATGFRQSLPERRAKSLIQQH